MAATTTSVSGREAVPKTFLATGEGLADYMTSYLAVGEVVVEAVVEVVVEVVVHVAVVHVVAVVLIEDIGSVVVDGLLFSLLKVLSVLASYFV